MARWLRRNPLLLGVLLAVAVLALYAPVAHYEFLSLDDVQYVRDNVHVTTGLKPANVVWAFTSFYEASWTPLAWISYMLDSQLFGVHPGPAHLENALLHAMNVVLLFLLLRAATGTFWRSALVSALFAFHPLNVETVAWVAERKSLLSAMFSLLTIAAYGWYCRRPNWKAYLTLTATFVLALLAKPMAVTLPLVLLLLDYWPLNRFRPGDSMARWKPLLLEKLPLLALGAAESLINIAAQRAGYAVAGGHKAIQLGVPIVSYVAYIGKTFWPHPLAVYYPNPEHALPLPQVLACALILSAITAAVLYLRRIRYLAVGWLLYLIVLLPASGIIKFGHILMADRFTYLPDIGIFIIVAWGLCDLVGSHRRLQLISIAMAACALLGLVLVTANYLRYWKNGVLLFTHVESVVPPDGLVEAYLADELASAGQYRSAYPHLLRSCELNPTLDACHYNLAIYYHRQSQFQEALEQYKLALQYTREKDTALRCLINSARIEITLGKFPAAISLLGGALQIDPGNSTAQFLRQAAVRQMAH